MPRVGLDFRQVDYLCLTHFHPDHVSDLVPFLFATNYTVDFTRSLPLKIIGPRGLNSFYEKLKGLFGTWIQAHTYPLTFQEVEEDHLSLADFELRTLPLVHSDASVGFRVSWEGRSLVYSGDTDFCPNIIKLGYKADLLVLECSFPDRDKKEGHLTPRLAGRIAREASCRRLLLTHFYPVFQEIDILKECRREFSGEILLAEDGMKINI